MFKLIIWALMCPIIIYDIPEGELRWSNVKPTHYRFCVPAAFTDTEGKIEGEYIIDGIVFNKNNKKKVSICNNTFYIDNEWRSDNGFQQLILVKNNKANLFKDERKAIRRALCKDNNKSFIIESASRITLSEFAKLCKDYCSDAVYLDSGIYGYGIINDKSVFTWAYFWRNLQTNWLYIE